ncbi:MAG: nucleotidyltransferase [Tenericutes bacterium]|nr:nucleotidyltransferase [Mycoplasmatota bacterium]
MNVVGIIAEYNPFHNGHVYQINKIKKLFKNSIIIVILNGNFTQRADVSVINKWDKTRILLDNNVDMVVELPIYYGINNADIFAEGALKILNELKIDTLVFGTERNNLDDFYTIVNAKKHKDYNKLVKKYLDLGYSYPTSCSKSLEFLSKIKIDTPNDILATSYINTIINNNYNIKPYGIKRTNDYHGKDITNISSASAIRNAIFNNVDYKESIPKNVDKYISNIKIDDYFDLIKYKILSCSNLSIYHDCKEGIDKRFKEYITKSNTLEEFISLVKTKRYTYSRIKRILLYILLDIKSDYVPTCYVRILGFNKVGRKYFKSIKDDITLPIVNNYSSNKELLSLEYKANSIYALKTNDVNKTINLELNKIIEK